MREKTKVKRNLYILLTIFIALIAILFYVDNTGHKGIPQIYEIRETNISGGFFTFKEYEDLKISTNSVYREVTANIVFNEQNISNTRVVLTNENFGDLYNLDFVSGEFFNREMRQTGEQYAVISENTALKLFLRVNPIGETIYINNYSYTIIGVYKSNNSFWSSLNQDNYERIYIPYTSYPDNSAIKVDVITLANNDNLYANIDKIIVEYPQYVYNLNKINYIEKYNYSTQFVPIFYTIIKILLIVLIIKLIYNCGKVFIYKMIKQKDEGYFMQLLKLNLKELIIASATLIVGSITIFFIAKTMEFPVVISDGFMPDERLFDIKHYMNKTVEFFKTQNTVNLSANKYHYLLVNKTFLAEAVLSILIYPVMFLVFKNIKKVVNNDITNSIELLLYTILIFIGVVILKTAVIQDFNTLYLRIIIAFVIDEIIYMGYIIYNSTITKKMRGEKI